MLTGRSRAFVLILASFLVTVSWVTGEREIHAWVNQHDFASVMEQLNNETWQGLIDGVQMWCFCRFTETGIAFDNSNLTNCTAVLDTIHDIGGTLELIVSGDIPQAAIDDPDPFIQDAIHIAQDLFPGIDGFSFDDERDCAPRATLSELEGWMAFHNAFADRMNDNGLSVSSAVQAMFGISDEKDNQPCLFPPYGSKAKYPSEYPFVPRVPELMNQASIQRWLVMDTYYHSTGHFLTTLDWHSEYVSNNILGIGMSNLINYRDKWTIDEIQARFYALHRSGVDWINVFLLPINDDFYPFLKRWKTYCQGCGKQTVLGCFDFEIECNSHQDWSSVEL